MDRIKRFFKDEAGTAEATSTVIMVAFVAIILAGAMSLYYGAFEGFFDKVATSIDGATALVVAWGF